MEIFIKVQEFFLFLFLHIIVKYSKNIHIIEFKSKYYR